MAEDFQARSVREGRQVQEIAASVLTGAGFRVLDRNVVVPGTGVTINIVAKDGNDDRWMFDVSGSFTSDRAGLIRTDTMWKSLGRASVLAARGEKRLILLTTNLPEPSTVGSVALGAAAHNYFDAVEMLTSEGRSRLRRYAAGDASSPFPDLTSAETDYPSFRRMRSKLGELVEVSTVDLRDELPTPAVRFDVSPLPYRLKAFIPSKDADGNLIPAATRNAVGQQIVARLSSEAGGCTGIEAVGSWVDPVGGVMHENVDVVEAYAASQFTVAYLHEIASLIVRGLGQHTAALVVDGVMILFTPEIG